MKKLILIFGLLCFITPAVYADIQGYGDNRDVTDRNTFEMDENILKEIEAARKNKNYSESNVNSTTSGKSSKSSTTKVKSKKNVPKPTNSYYHYGKPSYGWRGNAGS